MLLHKIKKVMSIIKTVIFCARHNIALRGHRHESGWNLGEHADGNPGNFLASLQFRAESGDQALLEHFSGSKSVKYTSPLIQNEIIKCAGDWVRETFLCEVRQQPFYAISADEATDCSNKEQMPFVVRFVDQDNNIREEFLDFILCDEGTTGHAIATKLIEELNTCGLPLSKLRGQCFDGAGNMAGRLNGAAAIIQRDSNTCKAEYFHCASHVLNLCIMSATSSILVRNMWCAMKEVSWFFSNSPKRQQCLHEIIEEKMPNATKRKLVDLCRTRWVARNNALSAFHQLYPAVVHALTAISSESR